MLRSWSITHWLAAVFTLAALCTGLAVTGLLSWQADDLAGRLAREHARTRAVQVFETVYASMRRGTAHDEIAEIMDRQNNGTGPGSVRLVRSASVHGQYGASPTDPEGTFARDPQVQAVLRTGRLAVTMTDGHLRALYPLLLEPECTACHVGTVGRTLNGVIDISVPLGPLRQPLSLLSDTAFLAFIGALGVIFAVVFVAVRHLIVNPIHALSDTMARLSEAPARKGQDVAGAFHTRELRRLAARFETLMARVSSQRADLEARTRALTEARDAAEEARVQADAANMAKSHFLASMSHELRTPLNAILGFSEILKDEMLGPIGRTQYREYAEDIHVSGTHLRDLVNDLLDLARIEAGRFDFHPEPLMTGDDIAACVRLFRERAAGSGLTIVEDCPAGLPPLMADPRALRQMICNLLSNAVKYTPEGGRIVVSARATPQAFHIAVTDTGIGVAREFQELIFTAYGQVDSVQTRHIEGTGLGLSLVKALMERHGGRVTLDSRPGQGATFTLVFPRTHRQDADPALVAPAA
jgi:signal transduction histidine kinase